MTPDQLRELAEAVEREGTYELSRERVAGVCRASAAALDKLSDERKLCEYFANGSIHWQHKYEAALEEMERLKHDLTRSAETNAELATRSEKAEAERDALKRHAEAMAENLATLVWFFHGYQGEKWDAANAALDAYREFKGE